MTKQAAQQPIYRGSILDADPPAQGVNIAGRMTLLMLVVLGYTAFHGLVNVAEAVR